MPDFATALVQMNQNDQGYAKLILLVGMALIAVYPVRRWVRLPALTFPSIGLNLNQDHQIKLIVALAAALRLPALTGSWWFDEAFTYNLINTPTNSFWPAIMADVHPPLYYLLMRPFAALLDYPALMRLTSLIVGLWGIVLIWRLVKVLGLGDQVAAVAALLWAVMPAHIYYSTELRSYVLMTNLVIAMLLAILQNRPKRFAVWLAALVWVHNAGVFYGAAFGLTALLYHRDKRWFKALVGGGLVASVWLPFMLAQAQNVAADHWAYINLGMVFYPLTMMTTGHTGAGTLIIVAVIAAATLTGLWQMRHWLMTKRGAVLLVGIFAVPVLEVILSVTWRPTYIWRHMLPCALLLAVVWAYLLVRSGWWRLALIPVIGLGLYNLYTDWLPQAKPDYTAWFRQLDCDSYYATSINAAFILTANGVNDVTVATFAHDNGNSIRHEDLTRFGFRSAAAARSGDCVLVLAIPAMSQAERAYVASLKEPPIFTYEVHNWRRYLVFRG